MIFVVCSLYFKHKLKKGGDLECQVSTETDQQEQGQEPEEDAAAALGKGHQQVAVKAVLALAEAVAPVFAGAASALEGPFLPLPKTKGNACSRKSHGLKKDLEPYVKDSHLLASKRASKLLAFKAVRNLG